MTRKPSKAQIHSVVGPQSVTTNPQRGGITVCDQKSTAWWDHSLTVTTAWWDHSLTVTTAGRLWYMC